MSINLELLQDLLSTDGDDKYLRKAVEELTELQLALLHFGDGKANRYNIAIEIADVKIQLEKLIYYFNIAKDVDSQYKDKVKNLEDMVYYDPNR